MATPSSILAWKILWTEEPGRLQSRGLQKSRKRLSTVLGTKTQFIFCCMYFVFISRPIIIWKHLGHLKKSKLLSTILIHFNIISLKPGICIFKISPDNSETVDHQTHLGTTECGKNTFLPGFKSYYIYISCLRAGTVLIKFYKPSTYQEPCMLQTFNICLRKEF